MPIPRDNLPIDAYLPEICAKIAAHRSVILHATPGCGKTTRVPPALLANLKGEVIVLEPRRLAARLAAERVASELGEEVGGTVGYQIRMDSKTSAKTRLKFVTEGLLLRQLIRNPILSGVSCVILDEFHERHIHSDIALAVLRWLQANTRPDLKIVVMSATLDALGLNEYLLDPTIISIQAPHFPVQISYVQNDNQTPLSSLVVQAVKSVLASASTSNTNGPNDVLVFLPGAYDIKQSAHALESQLHSSGSTRVFDIFELRADTPKHEQQQIFLPSPRRKIILSTNVAETSVTIPGITTVIDSGLAKISGFAPWSGLPTLTTKRISQAACIQRTGRAGRTAPGKAIRLYSEGDFLSRQPFEQPEVVRLELAHMLLDVTAIIHQLKPNSTWEEMAFLSPPPPDRIDASLRLLRWLGAFDKENHLTPLGKELAAIPLHPRLGRLLLEARKRETQESKLLKDAIWFTAGLSERSRAELSIHEQTKIATQIAGSLNHLGSNIPRDGFQEASKRSANQSLSEAELARCVLTGFPDRVAKKRPILDPRHAQNRNHHSFNLALGGGATVSIANPVSESDWIICLDGEESTAADAASAVVVRNAIGIDPLDLLDEVGFVREERQAEWIENAEQIRCFTRTYYGQLLIDETQVQAAGDENLVNSVRTTLAAAILKNWHRIFEESASLLEGYSKRRAFVLTIQADLPLPDLSGSDAQAFSEFLALGKTSFKEIRKESFENYIREFIGFEVINTFDRLAPHHVIIGQGRKAQVHYEHDRPPWIASRMQDFFGTTSTPTVGQGRVPVVVQLLAPNHRPVQVTQDLASFWKNSYPAIRRELSRNYPRHFWPEDPLTAEPPPPPVPRRPHPK